MGDITQLLTSALVSQGIGLAVNEFSRRSNLDQLQQRQALGQQQSAQDADLERERIAVNARQSEDERKKSLRRAVSRQRANFGAQGVGSVAGSSQAVLLGLFEESDEEKSRREELDALRLNSIDQGLSHSNSINVLQRAQLEERNRLNSLTANGRELLNIF